MADVRPRHIVFVDDELGVCHVVHKTLERVGMGVKCFQCAEDCLRHLAGQGCDLLITDVKMPGKDGIDLLAEVKSRMPWIPVLVVTGYGDVPLAVRALKSGAADFVEKPLDRETFLHAVTILVERHAGPVAALRRSLTKAEMKVLYLILEGRNNREIADALYRSTRTVEVHRGHVMRKLGVTSIVELLRRAADLGLFQSGPEPRDNPPVH